MCADHSGSAEDKVPQLQRLLIELNVAKHPASYEQQDCSTAELTTTLPTASGSLQMKMQVVKSHGL